MYSYATLDAHKALGNVSFTSDDAERRRLLEASTKQIDAYMRRTMRTYLANYYFTAKSSRSVLVDSEELGLGLLSVTTLKTDSAGDRTYATTWATTDYDLEPYNAVNRQRPYYEITKAPEGNYSFLKIAKGLEVVGKWGFYEDLVRSSSLMDEVLDATETDLDARLPSPDQGGGRLLRRGWLRR